MCGVCICARSFPVVRVITSYSIHYTKLYEQLSPADLAAETLIHDDNGEAWARWLAAVGLDGLQPADEIHVEKSIDALHLARIGAGFAINDQIITSNWISEGHLIQPFGQAA